MNFSRLAITKIPLDRATQLEIISEMHSSFLEFRHKEYKSLMQACSMGEDDIAARPEFYSALSSMLCNQLILAPEMAAGLLLPCYIGEDMIDCDHPDLKKPGERLRLFSDTFRNGGTVQDLPALIPEFPENASLTSSSGNKIVSFIQKFIAPFWVVPGETATVIALFTELSSLSEPSLGRVLPNWLKSGITFDNFSENTLSMCLDFVHKSSKYKWIETICRLGCKTWSENQKYQALWVESLAKRGMYEEALQLSKERLKEEPCDVAAAFVAGDIHLKHHRVDQALKAYAWAYKYCLEKNDALVSLSRAYNAAYLPEQADLCLKELAQLDPVRASNEKLPVELLIKCTNKKTSAFVNDQPVGNCPLHLRNMLSGSTRIRWIPDGEEPFETVVELLPGHNQKYKYNTSSGEIHEEISRDGMITLFENGESIELPTLIKEYLVTSFSDMPVPGIDEFF